MGNTNAPRSNQPAQTKPVQPAPATQGRTLEASQRNGAAVTESDEREAGLRDFIRTIKKFHKAKGTLAQLPKAAAEPAIKAIDGEIEKVVKVIHQWVEQQIKDALADD